MSKVAVFVDYENIHYTATNDYGHFPKGDKFARLFSDIAKERGGILVSKAYADWKFFLDMQGALASFGCQPVFVASKLRGAPEKGARKNSADIQMTIDVMNTLYSRDEVDTFVFFTGDRDFLSVINQVNGYGKKTVVCGFRTSMSEDIVRAANEAVILDTFLKWEPIVKTKKARVGHKDNWIPLIRRMAKFDRLPTVHWHFLRKHMFWKDLSPVPITRKEQDDYLNRARESGIINTKQVPNSGPNKDRYPFVTAAYLNTDHPEVQRVLEQMGRG